MRTIRVQAAAFPARSPWIPLLLLAALALAAAGCDGVRIADIHNDPSRFANRDVTIYGTVVQSVGALTEGVYEVDDGTGKLWVLAHGGGVPSKGARVRVKGRVNSGLTVGSRSYGTILRESSRKTERVG